jgi:multiple sugar transport system substrate-binding protein
MKWIFAVVFAVAIILSVIAQVSLTKDLQDDVVCTLVWATDDNPARTEQMELFRQWHQEKYGEKIGIRLDPVNYDFSKIVVQSLSGAGPDVFDFYGVESLERYISSGIILDVTGVAKEKGFNKELAWEGIWSSFVSNGRQYGFPDNVAAFCLLYNKNVFDRAGEPYPDSSWTWHKFLEVAKKISGPRGNGLRQYALMDIDPTILLVQNGAQMFSPEGTHCIFDSPEGIEALKFFDEMRTVHKVMPTAADLQSQSGVGGWGGGWVNMFATEYFATTAAGRFWFIAFSRDTKAAINRGKPAPFNLGVTNIPHFNRRWSKAGARCTGIVRTSKNIKYAYRFLEYLASETFNRQINRTYDALAPVKKYCVGPDGISDGLLPLPGLEAANDPVWATSMENASETMTSPFIPPYRIENLWLENKEALDAEGVTPEECLHRFAGLVNEEIQRNIKRDPELKKKYDAAIAREKEMAKEKTE